MRIPLKRRSLVAAAVAGVAVAALVLGFVLPPPGRPAADAASSLPMSPRLLVSEFGDEQSTLWLVEADAPERRTLFGHVLHAPGWELVGAVAPDGERIAYLHLPPGRRDPQSEAVLTVADADGSRALADGLDLRGGLAWSADGSAVYARRTLDRGGELPRFILLEIDVVSGQARTLLSRDDVFGLYPVGRPLSGPVYAVVIGSGGSDLVVVGGDGSGGQRLAAGITRDWTLSPDGSRLAFSEQHGVELEVRVASLVDEAPFAATQVLLSEAGIPNPLGTASPAWHPDGSLSIGTFGATSGSPTLRVQGNGASAFVEAERAQGFALPVAWSPAGTHLALRAFSGIGPGAPGEEGTVVIGPDGIARPLPGRFVRVLGWWNGDG